jgi:hypothetical protein
VPHARRTPRLSTALRKTVKWGGAVATLVLVVAWIGSTKAWVEWVGPRGRHVGVMSGVIGVSQDTKGLYDTRAPGFYAEFEDADMEWWFYKSPPATFWEFDVPLWFPALLCLLPTAYAWRVEAVLRRRARASLCPACGYDRAGLPADAVCPECGTPAPPATPPA